MEQQTLDLKPKNPDQQLKQLMQQDAINMKKIKGNWNKGINLDGVTYNKKGKINFNSVFTLEHTTCQPTKRGLGYYYQPCTLHI